MKRLAKTAFVLAGLGGVPLAHAITATECTSQRGVAFNTLSGRSCITGKNIGPVEGMKCLCICCVGEKTIDCAKNRIILVKACDAGKSLKFSYTFDGKETPDSIRFELRSETWFGGSESVKLNAPIREMQAAYTGVHQNRSYTSIAGYGVTFKDAPYSDCRVDSSQGFSFKIEACR